MRNARWITGVLGLILCASNAQAQNVAAPSSVVPTNNSRATSISSTNVLVPYSNACQERNLSNNFLGRLGTWLTYRPECADTPDDGEPVPRRAVTKSCAPIPQVVAQTVTPTCAPRCALPRWRWRCSLSFGWISFNRNCPPERACAKRPCPPVAATSNGNGFAARACDSSFRCGPATRPNCDVACPYPSGGQSAAPYAANYCPTPVNNWFGLNRSVGCGACGSGVLGIRSGARNCATVSDSVTWHDASHSGIVDPNQVRQTNPEGPAIQLGSPTPLQKVPRSETSPPPVANNNPQPPK